MNETADHGLSARDLSCLRQILQPYADDIERVCLFGSRATGMFRANSDIDLVIYGALDGAAIDRIRTLLNDSEPPVTVDVNAYHLIAYAPLKAHIDAVARPLFLKRDLAETAGA